MKDKLMKLPTWCLCWATILQLGVSGCGPVHNQIRPTGMNLNRIKNVGIVINKEPEVTVICDRSKASATPAFMFGLIGAAVASSYNNSQDQQKADEMDDSVNQKSLRSRFSDSLITTLRHSNKFANVQLIDTSRESETRNVYDAIMTVTIEDWGLRLIDRENDKMAAFVVVSIKMMSQTDKQMIWDEHQEVIGQRKEHFATFEKNKKLFTEQLVETIDMLGFKIANLLIYS